MSLLIHFLFVRTGCLIEGVSLLLLGLIDLLCSLVVCLFLLGLRVILGLGRVGIGLDCLVLGLGLFVSRLIAADNK